MIPDDLEDSETVIAAAGIANRILGSVNAPSLMQKVIARCVDAEVDVAAYDKIVGLSITGLLPVVFSASNRRGPFIFL